MRADFDFDASVQHVNRAMRGVWSAAGIEPASRASDWTVVRRMSLALAGTIPSLEELRRLESVQDAQRAAYWLAELLADPRTSDYLAERFARAFVGVEDGPFLIYRRRRFVSWLADELRANRPYDEIVRRLITEDGLWTDHPATNFITVSIKPDQTPQPDKNVLAARVSRAFLGVRLDCAECHDHPFRAWRQRDFQSLAAFFNHTRQSLAGIHEEGVEAAPSAADAAASSVPAVPFEHRLLAADGSGRQRLAHWVTHRENNAFAYATVNRAWAIMFGSPLVEPVDDIPREAEVPEVLNVLAADFVEHGFDLRRLLSVIGSSEAFQLDSRPSAAGGDAARARYALARWASFPVTRLRPEQVVGSLQQAASLHTINHNSHVLVRFARAIGQSEFVARYGDSGEDEFLSHGGTIPQRLLLMNGELVYKKTKDDLLSNAATQIAVLARDDAAAIDTAYLACLTRLPSPAERAHFAARLAEPGESSRRQKIEDLCWALINATEFSWNH